MTIEFLPETQQEALSISELNREVRRLLELNLGFIWVQGEVSNLARPRSGHWYFSLKDSSAQVNCAMFRNRNRHTNFDLDEGMEVLVRASVTLYEPRGNYQLVVEQMLPSGTGLLQQAFERLKAKLHAEGLFSSQRKRPLPSHVQTLGVITSPSGAALQDILKVLKRRAPNIRVIVYPSSVQGVQAPNELLQALRKAEARKECDVLLLARGGGSAEDLAAFNDESLARALSQINIPTVSGIGHEIDLSICDLVSDVSAPTPSAAAELLSQDNKQLLIEIVQKKQKLIRAIKYKLQPANTQLSHNLHRLEQRHPSTVLQFKAQKLDELIEKQIRTIKSTFSFNQQRIAALELKLDSQSPINQLATNQARLDNLIALLLNHTKAKLNMREQQVSHQIQRLDTSSPLKILQRGYAIVSKSDAAEIKPLATSKLLSKGDRVNIQFSDGRAVCQVEEISKG